ncbi:MAG: nitroreductase family protein [Zoogloeaceae bacterium]|jgi:nitroreductase|nr:nitroreductase family protein [Zoogloeaceae bacterium]
MSQTRSVENGVNPIFVNRWSPRAYDESSISEAELKTLFEAARWTPSAYNAQPWRFIYARRGTPQWATFLELLIPYNRVWAERASALVIAVSAQEFVPPGATEAIDTGTPSYDTGAAVGYLVLQASIVGLAAHIITGFDKEAARRVLEIPENYNVESAIVIGRRGNPEILSPELRARETPNDRQPLQNLIAEGRFNFK